MNKNFLTEKIENARELSFGDIFDQSIELFKKVWLQGFLKSLLQGVIGFIVSIIAYIPLIIVLGFFGLTVGIAGEDPHPYLHCLWFYY